MDGDVSIRWGWLKAMYIYTLFGAGGYGLALLFFPAAAQPAFGFPPQDSTFLKLYGSVLLASGLMAIAALRYPLKFVPLLLFQLIYKPIWLFVVALPLFLKGQFPAHAVVTSIIFLTYIAGNLIAIPFSSLFSKK